MAKKSAKQEIDQSEINEAVVEKKLARKESDKAKERKRRISKNKNNKRYTDIFKISKSRLFGLTGKKISRTAMEMLENRITSVFDKVANDATKYSTTILGKKRASKGAYDAQLDILKIKKSL